MTTDQTAATFFNPFDPAFRADPYPTYRRLIAEAPTHTNQLGFVVLTRYADCTTLLRHPAATTDDRKAPEFRERVLAMGLDVDAELARPRPFLFLDPPDHTRLRGLVNTAFTPRVVEKLRPRAQAIVDELLARVAAAGSMDVIEDLAYPLPVQIICELLGVPVEDQAKFREWTRQVARALDPEMAIPQEEQERRQQTFEAFREYFAGLVAKRREDPRDDLISALIAAEDQGDKLTHEELITTCVLLLIAGHETTVNLIGNGTLALLRHRDQLELLQRDPSLLRTAVEELLRFDPPVQLTGRQALEDIPLTDVTLQRGQQGIMLLAAANRDPAQFPDPERLDITREDNRHLAFGMGIHFCVGAPLARVEGQIAIGTLVRRFPDIALATDQPRYKEQLTLRGLESLPVTFTAA
jgi:cytochrome P450